MHLLVGHLSQDSTFDLFEFLSNFFFSKLKVQLICECGLYAGVYGIYLIHKAPYSPFSLHHKTNIYTKCMCRLLSVSVNCIGEQGWRCGESTRLPPMCPRFDSQTRHHMWVEFVVGFRPCSDGFSLGSPVFLPPQKSTFLNSNSIRNSRPQVCQSQTVTCYPR